jgi:hypothetical protein
MQLTINLPDVKRPTLDSVRTCLDQLELKAATALYRRWGALRLVAGIATQTPQHGWCWDCKATHLVTHTHFTKGV